MADLPLVDGLTQTAPDSEPVHAKLMAYLAQRPGGAQQDIAEGLAALERGFSRESDQATKQKIAAALAILRGSSSREDDR